MQVTEITVSAGRTFNHPFESYSNLRPHVTLKAALQEGESVDDAVKELQAKAERMVEDHKQALLRSLHELEHLAETEGTISSLERQIEQAQERLKQLREGHGEDSRPRGLLDLRQPLRDQFIAEHPLEEER